MVSTQVKDNLKHHPFKEYVSILLDKHFSYSIAKNFFFVFEAEKYHKGNTNILKQLKDEVFVMEVYYTNPSGLSVYICDLFSGWNKQQIELVLLKTITKAVVDGQIGKDWQEDNLKKVSRNVVKNKYGVTKG